MQIGYKPSIEIAHEQAMNNCFLNNEYPELKRRLDYDQTVLGISWQNIHLTILMVLN